MRLRLIDRYLLTLSFGTLGSVVAIVMSLMVLEHVPRLIDITGLSGERSFIVGQTLLGMLVGFLKSVSLVETAGWIVPSTSAIALLASWTTVVGFLVYWQRRAGNGALDVQAALVFKRVRLLVRPPKPSFSRSPASPVP